MTNHNENETTEQLPQPSLESRVTTLETNFQTAFSEINTKLDALIKMQQEMLKMQQDMYVDLRGRMSSIENDIHQIKLDIQPGSFQNRLMHMGQ